MTPKEWANKITNDWDGDDLLDLEAIIEHNIEAALAEEREAWMQYAGVLTEELNSCAVIAWMHGWQSSRAELGQVLREKLQISVDDIKAAALRAQKESA